MMNESLLREILSESYKHEYAEFDNTPEHKFSLKHRIAMKHILSRYERNVRKLQKREEASLMPIIGLKPGRSFKQRLILATIIIILMTFLVGWVVVFISQNFSGTVHLDNTHLSAKNIDNCPQTIEYKYALASVPEGFEMIETNTSRTNAYTLYLNPTTKQEITLWQWVKESYKPHFNTENNQLEEVDINSSTGLCIDFSDVMHSHSLIVWDNGDYIIEIVADLTKESTINLSKINKVY